MSRTEFVRFACNNCRKEVDVVKTQDYPPGWERFEIGRAKPNPFCVLTVDLCGPCSKAVMFFVSGAPNEQARDT